MSAGTRRLSMTVMSTVQVAVLGIAFMACVFDIRTSRIPNALTFGSAMAALTFHFATGGTQAFALAVSGWFVGMALLFILYALGGMGAGDVKLLGALGAWLGPIDAVWLVLFSGMAGGVMALAVGIIRGCLGRTWRNVGALLMHWRISGLQPLPELTLETSPGPRLAYAVPILVAAMVIVWLR
jgi:prepilin peptidase CpaA